MKVSVVVPFFNHLRECQEMWKSLVATMPADLDYEFVLIDDQSSDGTREWLATISRPNVKLILNESNLGYAASMNAGAQVSAGEVIIFANSDLVFLDDWLIPMVSVLLDKNLDAGIVGNIQYRLDNREVDHVGMCVSLSGKWIHRKEIPSPNVECIKVPAVTGACVAIRRRDFFGVGGFDLKYLNGAEDVDLCLRLARNGLLSYVATKSLVLHHIGLSRGTVVGLSSELNSKKLYAAWRDEIKHMMASEWSSAFASLDGSEVAPVDLDGSFKPHNKLCPMLLAEHRLECEEYRWRSVFFHDFKLREVFSLKRLENSSGSLVSKIFRENRSKIIIEVGVDYEAPPDFLRFSVSLRAITGEISIIFNRCHIKLFKADKINDNLYEIKNPFWLRNEKNSIQLIASGFDCISDRDFDLNYVELNYLSKSSLVLHWKESVGLAEWRFQGSKKSEDECMSSRNLLLKLSGEVFIRQAYLYALERPVDASGMKNYLSHLAVNISKEDILSELESSDEGLRVASRRSAAHSSGEVDLSESSLGLFQEKPQLNNLQVVASVNDLIAISGDEFFLRAAYFNLLGRGIDPEGLSNYIFQLARGCSREQVVFELATSPEGHQAGSSLPGLADLLRKQPTVAPLPEVNHVDHLLAVDSEAFVRAAYLAILHREADPEGLALYTDLLQQGWSRSYVLNELVTSEEGRTLKPDLRGLIPLLKRYRKAQLRSWLGWYHRAVKGAESDLPQDRLLRAALLAGR